MRERENNFLFKKKQKKKTNALLSKGNLSSHI